jgi:hypothetical protein
LLHRPASYEGTLFAELIPRLETQLRVISGSEGLLILGVDMVAALALGGALGLPAAAVAEWLPGVEAVAVRAINRKLHDDRAVSHADD